MYVCNYACPHTNFKAYLPSKSYNKKLCALKSYVILHMDSFQIKSVNKLKGI